MSRSTNLESSDDLVTRLRSNEGLAVRESVLAELDALQARVRQAQSTGIAPHAYADLAAVSLAVQAARDTLKALAVSGQGFAATPLRGWKADSPATAASPTHSSRSPS